MESTSGATDMSLEHFFCQMPTSRTHFLCFCQFLMKLTPKLHPKWTTPFSRKLHKTRLCHQKGPPGFQKSPKYTPKPSKVGTKALQIEVLSLKIDRWKRTIVCLFSYWRNDDMQDLESKKWSEECKRLSEKKLARANHVGGTVAATPRSGTGLINPDPGNI